MVRSGQNHLYKFTHRSRGILTALWTRGKDTAATTYPSQKSPGWLAE